jgi:hypothetical protein
LADESMAPPRCGFGGGVGTLTICHSGCNNVRCFDFLVKCRGRASWILFSISPNIFSSLFCWIWILYYSNTDPIITGSCTNSFLTTYRSLPGVTDAISFANKTPFNLLARTDGPAAMRILLSCQESFRVGPLSRFDTKIRFCFIGCKKSIDNGITYLRSTYYELG